MRWIVLVAVLLFGPEAWSEEISLIENKPALPQVVMPAAVIVNDDVPLKEEQGRAEFEEMRRFMIQENDRLKEIKILNLDLERASLELKKREIEVKIAGLDGEKTSVGFADSMTLRVLGIFINGDKRKAILSVKGRSVYVDEGQSMNDGALVKAVGPDSVVLLHPDGKEEKIELGS